MLIGEYTHSIDDKNRLSLPVKFRQELGKKVVLTPGLDSCLFVFTIAEWEKFTDKLSHTSIAQADSRSFNRYILGGAVEAEVDSVGRILVPDFLKSRARLEKEVAIIGVQNRAEIWNSSAWAEYKKVVEKQADTLAEKLGSVGML